MGRVDGKVAFITGAARGQGRSHALRLAEEGADVIAIDVCQPVDVVTYGTGTEAELRETVNMVEDLGRSAIGFQADVRDFTALADALREGVERLGDLNVVVANAGIVTHTRLDEMPEAEWQDVIDINLTGVWQTCKAATPYLRSGGGGSIVVISSGAGLKGVANIGHYSAAKHGLVGLTRSLANELAIDGIRANSIHPTMVDTPMIRHREMYELFRPDLSSPTQVDIVEQAKALNAMPVPWVESIDVSNAVLFLASDEARYITGAALPVDAGYAIK